MDLYTLLPTDDYLPEKGMSTKAEFHIQNTEYMARCLLDVALFAFIFQNSLCFYCSCCVNLVKMVILFLNGNITILIPTFPINETTQSLMYPWTKIDIK